MIIEQPARIGSGLGEFFHELATQEDRGLAGGGGSKGVVDLFMFGRVGYERLNNGGIDEGGIRIDEDDLPGMQFLHRRQQ